MRIIAGRFRGKRIHSPDDDTIRPTSDRVKEALFSILASRLPAGFVDIKVLDLFAGTGALGLEALSRGAQLAAFVDNGVQARGIIRSNIEFFGIGGQTKLLKRDATDLGTAEKFLPFDLIFLDPPYGHGMAEKALESGLDGGWFASSATLVLEEKRGCNVTVPGGFEMCDSRDYGASTVRFLKVLSG
ncbi:MAG: 16S rRNA (guanine(966)-N(2))-methyltransferase RsmD [Devosiaceae bacterium]|nr:16S rRNA (guanine(966)-N(2))-methyltransferase RsmD [Devosiaceae bacterium]